ncbi:CWC16 protein, partial [Gorgonomyces haynaldii]
MAERKVQNKYYPPDYDHKYGTLNAFVKGKQRNQLQLQDKTIYDIIEEDKAERQPGPGTRKVKFEMPFQVWCLGDQQKLEHSIGMGVRFNAAKSFVQMYHTTPIFLFEFKCHECSNYIKIQTDPKNAQYQVISGARAKVAVVEVEKKPKDGFQRLEQEILNQEQAKQHMTGLTLLTQDREKHWKDTFEQSKRVRSKFK